MKSSKFLILSLLAASTLSSRAVPVWTVDLKDGSWPIDGVGGGGVADFLQENGAINALPGLPTSGTTSQSSDNDYYFAGIYSTTLPGNVASYGSYNRLG